SCHNTVGLPRAPSPCKGCSREFQFVPDGWFLQPDRDQKATRPASPSRTALNRRNNGEDEPAIPPHGASKTLLISQITSPGPGLLDLELDYRVWFEDSE